MITYRKLDYLLTGGNVVRLSIYRTWVLNLFDLIMTVRYVETSSILIQVVSFLNLRMLLRNILSPFFRVKCF